MHNDEEDMSKYFSGLAFISVALYSAASFAHYPFVAPLSYQTFNNHTAIIAGFYDNPFAAEVAIKNFKFHYHTPTGEKIYLDDTDWSNTQTLSSYSLENKQDGTYRIRGEKLGNTMTFAQFDKSWKTVIQAAPKTAQAQNDNVVYAKDLKKNTPQKTVQNIDIIETFVSRRQTSDRVIQHIHEGFDVQFLTHPNVIQQNQPIQLKILDNKQGIAALKVEILAPTTDFSREEKVYQSLKTDETGALNFKLAEKGQYLLKIDYQQPFSMQQKDLKRYKYTLAFNVMGE